MMRRLVAIVVAALAFGTLSGLAAYQKVRPQAEGDDSGRWQEIAWPFPRDGWPAGRAFRCGDVAACGGEAEIYVRPKIGFCNCDTGVADDDEVDRVADLDLITPRFAPREQGRGIRVADLAGRSRDYDLAMSDGSKHAAIGIALSHRCDLLVAVTQGAASPDALQRAALDFLASQPMHRWMLASLGGK
jgi:hypothetical protein